MNFPRVSDEVIFNIKELFDIYLNSLNLLDSNSYTIHDFSVMVKIVGIISTYNKNNEEIVKIKYDIFTKILLVFQYIIFI